MTTSHHSKKLGLALGTTWEATEDLDLLSAHEENERVTLAKCTRMRVEQSLPAANTWFHTVLFRFFVLEGPQAGDGVWLETDERAEFPRYGLWPAL